MRIGDRVRAKKHKKVYIYLDDSNRIASTLIPIIPEKRVKEIKEKGFISIIIISQCGKERYLDDFIYAYNLKKCKEKVKNYIRRQIKEWKNKLKDLK